MINRKELLERLSNAHGVSGYEGNIRQIIEDEIRPYVDKIKTDNMGNLIGTKIRVKISDMKIFLGKGFEDKSYDEIYDGLKFALTTSHPFKERDANI